MRSFTAIGIGVPVALGVAMLTPPQRDALAAAAASETSPVDGGQIPLHTREEFAFTVDLPVDRALPLFGAVRERDWAPDWSPDIIWPTPAVDREGMVFSVAHGEKTALWVNTALDPAARRVQYVCLLPGIVATVITIALTGHDRHTRVSVRYERTALALEANHLVEEMAAHDRAAGPVWQRQIRQYLSGHRD
jgi:hypothetical protein